MWNTLDSKQALIMDELQPVSITIIKKSLNLVSPSTYLVFDLLKQPCLIQIH